MSKLQYTDSNNQLGTNKNGIFNTDYCRYCYKNGVFIDNVNMDKFIEMCSQFSSQTRMTNQEMKEYCKVLFPTLKRWKIN